MNWIVWLILAWIALIFVLAALFGWANGRRARQMPDSAFILSKLDHSSDHPRRINRPDLLAHGRSITR